MPLSIGVYSKVRIYNARILCFYWLLLLCIMLLLAGRFLLFRQFETSVDATENMSVILGLPPISHEEEAKIKSAQQSSPLCTAPERYTYTYSEFWKYDPTGCFDVCVSHGRTRSDCEPSASLHRLDNDKQGLFMTTFRRRTWDAASNFTADASFSTLADYARISLRIEYAVPAQRIDRIIRRNFEGDFAQMAHQDAGLDLLVVLAKATDDGKGMVIESVSDQRDEDRANLLFSVDDLLRLTGRPDLDAERTDFKKNAGEGNATYPIGRLTGEVIYVMVSCANTPHDVVAVDVSDIFDSSKHSGVCLVFLESRRLRWAWVEYVDYVSSLGENVKVYDGGVEVRVSMKAVFRQLDISRILLQLSSFIVLMGLPKALVAFFMTWCLGRLSTIFSRAINKPFRVESALTAMVTRLMSYTYALKMLGDGGERVTKEKITGHLMELLTMKSAELDPTEATHCVDFIYASIAHKAERSKNPRKRLDRELVDGLVRSSSISDSSERGLVLKDLAEVATFDDAVDFNIMVKLFDVKHRDGFLERLFMPPNLARVMGDLRMASRCSGTSVPNEEDLGVPCATAKEQEELGPSQQLDVDLACHLSGDLLDVTVRSPSSSSHEPQARSAAEEDGVHVKGLLGAREASQLVAGLVERVERLEAEVRQLSQQIQQTQQPPRTPSKEAVDRASMGATSDAVDASAGAPLRRNDLVAEGPRLLELCVAGLEEAAEAREVEDGDAGVGHLVVSLEDRITELERAVKGGRGASVGQHVTSLENRIAELERKKAAANPAAANPAAANAAAAAASVAAVAALPQGAAARGLPHLQQCTSVGYDIEIAVLARTIERLDCQMRDLLRRAPTSWEMVAAQHSGTPSSTSCCPPLGRTGGKVPRGWERRPAGGDNGA